MNWINDVNTTNLRIITSLGLAVIYVAVVLVGVTANKSMNVEALNTVGLFIFGMMGVDAAQFIGKRFSDTNYAAAKAQPNVNVNAAPAMVQVAPAPVAAPDAPHPTSERGD